MEKSTDELMQILKSKKTYKEFLSEEIDELYFCSVSEYLEFLIAQKNLKKSDVILRSNLDKNYAYQIFNGNKKKPSRDKIIMIAFGMGLSVEETKKLLKIAGVLDLYVRIPRDSAILFCLDKHFSLIQTNEMLEDMSMDILE